MNEADKEKFMAALKQLADSLRRIADSTEKIVHSSLKQAQVASEGPERHSAERVDEK